jgi:hypothetical protein
MDEGGNLLGRNADEHDRLMVSNEPSARNFSVRRKTNQNLYRLAGVTGGIHPVGVHECVADKLVAREGSDEGRRVLGRTVAVSAGHDFSRRRLGEKFGEMAFGSLREPTGRQKTANYKQEENEALQAHRPPDEFANRLAAESA